MLVSMRAFGLTTGLLLFALQGALHAQEPAPDQGQAAKPAAQAGKKYVLLTGREDLAQHGPLTFGLQEGGEATMYDISNRPIKGTWRELGDRVTIQFADCVYEGKLAGKLLSGRATFTSGPSSGVAWNFQVVVQDKLAGRNFSGEETLEGFGDLTFRFLANGAVEMIDTQGKTMGSYTLDGDQVTLTFGDVVYRGEMRGQTISGTATNGNPDLAPWNFTTTEKVNP